MGPIHERLSGTALENNSTGHYAQPTSDISIQESWLHKENVRMSHKHTSQHKFMLDRNFQNSIPDSSLFHEFP